MGLEEARAVFGRERGFSGSDDDRCRVIRDRLANAERSDFCMMEFVAHAKHDVEYLLDHHIRDGCDNCDEYEGKYESAQEEICSLEREIEQLEAANIQLEEQIAELKDSLKQLTFRGGL